MAMFRARVSFAGLQGPEVGRLNRLMLRLSAGLGVTTRDLNSPGGDTPTSRIYLFSSVNAETVTEFIAWLQDHIQQEIQIPIAFTAQQIDEVTGVPLKTD